MNPSETQNMYLRLGVEKGADYNKIKKAYRKYALYWHPDRNQDKKKSHIEFIAVSEAFEILSRKSDKRPFKNYQASPKNKEGTYEYYNELFKKIFGEDSIYLNKMSPELRTIIEIFKKFGM